MILSPSVLFLGSDAFSIRIFQAIRKSLPLSQLFVVTPSPVRFGRSGRNLYVSPLASSVKLDGQVKEVLQIGREDTKMKEFQLPSELLAAQDKILITASFGYLVPSRIMRQFSSCINVHPSLLPDYRGAAPVPWTIINGDKLSGTTIQLMSEKVMDCGKIMKQKSVELTGKETTPELLHRLADVSAEILSDVLKDVEHHSILAVEQQNFPPPDWHPKGAGPHVSTWRRAKKLTRQISHISLTNQTASEIERIDRAVRHFWPITCRTVTDRTIQLYLHETMPVIQPSLFSLQPGHIQRIPPNTLHMQGDEETIAVGTNHGALHVIRVKEERHRVPLHVDQWKPPTGSGRYFLDYE